MTSLPHAYAPPVEDRPEPESTEVAGVGKYWLAVRLHVALVVVGTVVALGTAVAIELELFDPPATFGAQAYARWVGLHGLTLLLAEWAPAMGVIGLVALPRALKLPALPGWWWTFGSVAIWPLGVLMLLVMTSSPAPGLLDPLEFWAIGVVVAGLGMLAGQIVWTVVVYRDRIRSAPVLAAGLGGAAVLQLLAFGRSVLQFFGPGLGLPTLGSGLTYLAGLTIPVSMAVAAHTLVRDDDRGGGWTAVLVAALVVPSLAGWIPQRPLLLGLVVLLSLASMVAFVVALAGPVLRSSWRDMRTWAALFVVLATGLQVVVRSLLASLSVDVHLHDTYFQLAPLHLGWLAVFLSLAIVVRGEPRVLGERRVLARIAMTGTIGTALGLGAAFLAMLGLGQSGMPRRYVAYIDAFAPQHQRLGIFALVGAIGCVLLLIGLVGRRERS
jgi:heme/copper-type cytochrome/quinol oxidase subunit 1